jgi:nucleotide-binding universal stress UspA family protein
MPGEKHAQYQRNFRRACASVATARVSVRAMERSASTASARKVQTIFERTKWLDRLHGKSSAAPDGDHVANRKLLPLGQNALSARGVEISEQTIELVIAVEAATPVAHLLQPWPDGRRRGFDRDAECRFVARQRHLHIAGHGAMNLGPCRSPGSAPPTQSIHIAADRTVRALNCCPKTSKRTAASVLLVGKFPRWCEVSPIGHQDESIAAIRNPSIAGGTFRAQQLSEVNMITMANVLVATDFGEAAESALAYGREFARTFGARLHVLHVVENPLIWAGPDAAIDLAQLQRDMEAAAQTKFDRLVTEEDRQQLRAVTVIRSGRKAAEEIADHARLAAIDLIILGTHGRSGMSHVLMGSVADKVVRIAPCPVLTVRHPEHEFILPDALETVERRTL